MPCHRMDRRRFLRASGLAAASFATPAQAAPTGRVLGQPDAARVGEEVLSAGGNAVDAIVAAALVAAAVSIHNCGLGGYGGHAVIATPEGVVTAIDFNTAAPAAAREDMYPLDERGAVKGAVNTYGWLAAGVPGIPAGLELALKRFGSRPLAELLQPAIRAAREGFPLAAGQVTAIRNLQARIQQCPAAARLLLPDGAPPVAGAVHRNPDLADLLRTFADRGSFDSFYRGDVAARIAEAFAKDGGLITAADLAAYRAREVEPLRFEWGQHSVRTAPLTAGGASVLEALGILKALEWDRMPPGEPKTLHARVEAVRIAWGDRLSRFGDPEQARVPLERLLSAEYAARQAARVREALANKKALPGGTDGLPGDGTVNLSAVDERGMLAALTLTHGAAFGALATVEGLGLVLGHGMSRFDPHPGRPNSPGPGKRPLNNMCPTVVLRDGKPVLAIGGAGGRRIPNSIYDVLARYLAQGLSLEAALTAPRIHTEGDLNLVLDARTPEEHVTYLQEAGYTVRRGGGANISAVEFLGG